MSGDIEAKVSAYVNSLSPEERREAVQYLRHRPALGRKSCNHASGAAS